MEPPTANNIAGWRRNAAVAAAAAAARRGTRQAAAPAARRRPRLARNLGLPPLPAHAPPRRWTGNTTKPVVRQLMNHPLFGQYLEAYISQLRTPQPELPPSVIVIPPENMPFTAADLAKFWKTYNAGSREARNFRRNLAVSLRDLHLKKLKIIQISGDIIASIKR